MELQLNYYFKEKVSMTSIHFEGYFIYEPNVNILSLESLEQLNTTRHTAFMIHKFPYDKF
jgi:hypothetical protein